MLIVTIRVILENGEVYLHQIQRYFKQVWGVASWNTAGAPTPPRLMKLHSPQRNVLKWSSWHRSFVSKLRCETKL